MPRTDYNQTWDSDGNLVSEEIVEVPDPEPTPEELADAALDDAIDKATTLAQLKDALRGRFTNAAVKGRPKPS